MTDFRRRVVAVLRGLEPGQVVTYGEIAREAGFPGAARAVGTLLRDLDCDAAGVPWWRVVTAGGRLAPGVEAEQAARLAAEGVTVRSTGAVRVRRPP